MLFRSTTLFPSSRPWFNQVKRRMLDLLRPFRDFAYYHPDQHGSASIKAVLPTIAPHLDYATLAVRDGGDAVAAYREAVDVASTPARRAELDAALRLYCGRDVEAMRVVAERLIESGPVPCCGSRQC